LIANRALSLAFGFLLAMRAVFDKKFEKVAPQKMISKSSGDLRKALQQLHTERRKITYRSEHVRFLSFEGI
jgi:hypothetical protein